MSERDGDTGGPPGGEPAGGPVDRRRGRLTLLGTGTCQLEADRMASSVLLELGGLRVVFDFGRGISLRLLGLGLRQDDVEHVVLSHFHPDHLSDLIPYLQAAAHSRVDPRSRDLHLYGPTGLEAQIGRLLGLFEPTSLVDPERYAVRLHEIAGDQVEIDGRRFLSAELPPAGNRGLGFDHRGASVRLTGDSDFHPAEIDFLRGADLAIFDAGHLQDGEIVELAVASGARRMVCSHLYREIDAASLTGRARARGYRGRIEVGADGQVFEL